MDNELYKRVSDWFDDHREAMVRDIERLVRIPSVSEPSEEQPPFGQACRDCMDEMLAMGREHGFSTENYDYYAGSIGGETKDWDNMIGLWNHLDVVPAGNGWSQDPFEPVRKKQFLIGRGADDNKGPAVGMLYVMKCIRELGIPMEHELRLFVGCDEERGMEDLAWYARQGYPYPKLSMIADSGFPVCYGEKGIVEGWMYAEKPFSEEVLECEGGSASNMIPDLAWVKLRCSGALERELAEKTAGEQACAEGISWEIKENSLCIRAKGTSRHSAFPEGSRNAVHELAAFLAGLESLTAQDREIFRALAQLSEGYDGAPVGICYSDEVSGSTTCAATVLRTRDRHAGLQFNIRYAITADKNALLESLKKSAERCGLVWEPVRVSEPNYFPKEHPAVKILTDLFNEVTGEARESFTMGGGTYARKLPNAFAYGVGGMKDDAADREASKELFAPGHGGAHGPDEALNVRKLTDALKIYVMALHALNGCSL
ncbi:MAG: Sapep family Mn(2+)-dependent dipeptidase [Eubacteriales bacterium]|nr:Sapep family Mn(2+)-dependent dipeptidase [Eubacteriales bacterium]